MSILYDVSSGTHQMIEQQLREAAVALDTFENRNSAHVFEQTNNQTQAEEPPGSPNGPLSPGSIAPNISAPGNMLDSADRQLINIFHSI